jgi:putative transposase
MMHATIEQKQRLRHKAAELFEQCLSNAEIARRLKVSRPTISKWHTRFEKEGVAGLKISPPGAGPRLSQDQWQQIIGALVEGPRAHGFDTDLWTLSRIADVIEKTTGVRYNTNYVAELMGKIGWTCQKPETRAKERNEDAIKRWREHTWPQIKKGLSKKTRP